MTAGCSLPSTFPDSTETTPGRAGLAGLVVAAETHADTYQRSQFGQRWKDTDHNGCRQRDDILARDLHDVRHRGHCTVIAGTLTDPYDGRHVTFTKTRATNVQIDHIVALADAWRSGAWSWTPDRREALANDPNELQASAATTNQAKSDHDAATWQPADPTRACAWARQVIQIKTHWGLTADPAEADALATILNTCPTTTR